MKVVVVVEKEEVEEEEEEGEEEAMCQLMCRKERVLVTGSGAGRARGGMRREYVCAGFQWCITLPPTCVSRRMERERWGRERGGRGWLRTS
jgi:hypothetical protein